MRPSLVVLLALLACGPVPALAGDGNRLTYLDSPDPYYPHRDFPKLTTPQWVGEEGVDAVVILAIDDMRDPAKYEQYLRPILQRLKQIDGRAPVSIMTCNVKPEDPQLQTWLDEGLSIEIHTVDHPCPLLQGGDFAKAKSTYDRCIDLMHQIPRNEPVAFRMPCCDSLNTVSPRFFAEIFNATTPLGHHLGISSSVFNVFTSDDPEIPCALVLDADGRERFEKYLPQDRTFVNTIENYPYPYVINRLCWEFPCVAPSDWSAQHYHGKNNPQTVEDWKAALDITVRKQGVMNLVFHPHGWITSEQVVELIDHAVSKHGKKVKFLTFREALERLNRNLLDGIPLRAADGDDRGVRLLDLNHDGYLDVATPEPAATENAVTLRLRIWSPRTERWQTGQTRLSLSAQSMCYLPVSDGAAVIFAAADGLPNRGSYRLKLASDAQPKELILWDGPKAEGERNRWQTPQTVPALDCRDLDGDGRCELLVEQDSGCTIFAMSDDQAEWRKLPFSLPMGTRLGFDTIGDAGLRFVDIDEDGHDDIVFSNAERYGIWLWQDMQTGWSKEILSGKRGDKDPKDELPPIVRADGTNNGFFVHSRHLFWQNEDTAKLKDLVDRRSFDDLLEGVQPGPKSPDVSLELMETRPGFEVELVAAEPLTMDPVAFDWGPDGKFWIVEMADYPLGMDGKGQPGGRVRYLEDTDGDGRYDKSTLFLDGIPFPTGVMAWRGGVLVTAAPDLFYAEDTDGDGRADMREVLFTGFGEGNQQHRVNGLVWGLDNWVYCANGDSNGQIKSLKTGEVVNISGRDLRVRPDTGEIDPQTGRSQYGRNRDDWGNWFGCNNSNPMFHFVLADRYLRRNPHVVPPDPVRPVSQTPGAAPCYPISRTLERFNDFNRTNRFTSANSAMVYRDDLFGPQYAGYWFVSEPVHNLVHRQVMAPQGVTFTSRRADDEQQSEFFASRDNWFRPAMLKTGPDGALWIADMYRHVIEHPEWIPKEWQERLDLRAGADRGRIYRVYPKGVEPRPIPRLDTLTTPQLVAALDSPGGWQRDTAQRLLIHRDDRAAVPLLQDLARTADRPLARLHALCTLDGLDALTPTLLTAALADPHPGVRRHAVRLSEPLLERRYGENPDCFGSQIFTALADLLAALLSLWDDPDPHVQLQLAYTLGELHDPRAAFALGQLALRHRDNPYLTAAVLSSTGKHNIDQVLTTVLRANDAQGRPTALLEKLIAIAAASGEDRALLGALRVIVTTEEGKYDIWQFRAVGELAAALARSQRSLPDLLKEADPQSGRELSAAYDAITRAALRVARDRSAALERRLAALPVSVSATDNPQKQAAALREYLVPQEPPAIQSAAVAQLGRIDHESAAAALLDGWKQYGAALRSEVLDALLSRADWTKRLLDGIAAQRIAPSGIDAARRQRLLTHKDAELRKRAEELLAGTIHPDRQKILDDYRAATELTGNAERGRERFAKICANCHRLNGDGHEVGPDLAALKDKSPAALLVAILDPNRAVEAKYLNYTALTTAGRTFSGLLAAETGNSIALLGPEAKRVELLRADLEELTSTAKSTMPEGLEKDLPPQDVADLIAYLRATEPPREPKTFPGNAPAVVAPRADGTLRLDTSTCAIYGPSLVLEDKYRNLGWWSHEDDHAVWSVRVPRDATYEVFVTFACDDSTAGNVILFGCAGSQLTRAVPGTGNWDTYRRERFGELTLSRGEQRLIVRPAGPVRGALIDLKRIELVPKPAR